MQAGETITSYAARLREKAQHCLFDDVNDRILEHIIQETKDEGLVRKTIQGKWDLEKFIVEAGTRETLQSEIKEMKNEFKVANRVQSESRGRGSHSGYRGRFTHSRSRGRGRGDDRGRESERKSEDQQSQARKCFFCDKEHPFGNREECPAYGRQCMKCGRNDHFSVCCRGGRTHTPQGRGYYWRGPQARVRGQQNKQEQRAVGDESNESDNDNVFMQCGSML